VLITIEDTNNEQKINKQLFYPNNLKISEGTSIIWVNKDNLPHTITLKKLNEQPQEFKFALSLGDSYKHTFEKEGTYGFYSDKNKWSEGKITVS
jgi:plastocyanin